MALVYKKVLKSKANGAQTCIRIRHRNTFHYIESYAPSFVDPQPAVSQFVCIIQKKPLI